MLALAFWSCDWFATREPEDPDTGRSSFQPPTSADIVVSNFVNSLYEKNADNFLSCLADSTQTASFSYLFLPSAEANALFSSIFSQWERDSERQWATSMITSIESGVNPDMRLTNSRFEVLLPDSAVHISDYYLVVNHNIETIPEKFAGTMQLTLRHDANGLWSISRWIDTKAQNDSIPDTWSILKAQFFNK